MSRILKYANILHNNDFKWGWYVRTELCGAAFYQNCDWYQLLCDCHCHCHSKSFEVIRNHLKSFLSSHSSSGSNTTSRRVDDTSQWCTALWCYSDYCNNNAANQLWQVKLTYYYIDAFSRDSAEKLAHHVDPSDDDVLKALSWTCFRLPLLLVECVLTTHEHAHKLCHHDRSFSIRQKPKWQVVGPNETTGMQYWEYITISLGFFESQLHYLCFPTLSYFQVENMSH